MKASKRRGVLVVHARPEDRRGDGIWGIFSSIKKAEKALALDGLRFYDPIAHHADDPEHETPLDPDERECGFYALDYRRKR